MALALISMRVESTFVCLDGSSAPLYGLRPCDCFGLLLAGVGVQRKRLVKRTLGVQGACESSSSRNKALQTVF